MSIRLVVAALEIRPENEPDWEAAGEALGKLSRNEAARSMSNILGDSHQGNPFVRIEKAFENVKSAWIGEHDGSFTKLHLKDTELLIAGGNTDDKRIQSVDDVDLFVESGLAKAAGFLVDD